MANRQAMALGAELRMVAPGTTVVLSGCVGPRGDGYGPDRLMDGDEAAAYHSEQVAAAIDKAGDFVDEKTEGKYAEQVDKGQEMARDKLADLNADEPEQPA